MQRVMNFRPAVLAAAMMLSVSSLAWADSEIGDNTVINTRGTVDNQVALAVGENASANNNVGGVQIVGNAKIGKNVRIDAQGEAKNQVALAVGAGAQAANNVGGVQIIGGK